MRKCVWPLLGIFFGALLLVGAIACEEAGVEISENEGSADGDADSDGDGDGDSDDDGFDDDDDGQDTETGSDTEICEEWDSPIVPKASRVMIVQDKSLSMLMDENGIILDNEDEAKWGQAKRALSTVLESFDEEVDFGLTIFPSQGACGVDGSVQTDTLPLNAQAIEEIMSHLRPFGGTPLWLVLEHFTDPAVAPVFTADDADSYLLVTTDGEDSCGQDGEGTATPEQLGQITAELFADHDIKTMVIGFGTAADPAQLNAIAAAGGTEFDEFIDAQDEAELQAALEEIISTMISCVYVVTGVDDPDADLEKANFYFVRLDANGNEVKHLIGYDEDCKKEKGWTWQDFEKLQVKFCEQACEELQQGDVIRIIAEFGCEPIPIE